MPADWKSKHFKQKRDVGRLTLMRYSWHARHGIDRRRLRPNVDTLVIGSGIYNGDEPDRFVEEAASRLLYFSYRHNFHPLPDGHTTDANWGCLLRTGQMLMARALVRHFSNDAEEVSESVYERVRAHFMDTPNAPFSVHRMERDAFNRGVKYATFLTPSQTGRVLASVCRQYRDNGGQAPVTICCDGRDINAAQALETLRQGEAMLFLVPVYLGFGKLTEKYIRILLRLLEMRSICGIAGGRKKASFYLIGHQNEVILYFDPHYVQSALTNPSAADKVDNIRGRLPTHKIDPCMLLGFYVPDEAAFHYMVDELNEVNSQMQFPLISITSYAAEDYEAGKYTENIRSYSDFPGDEEGAEGEAGAANPLQYAGADRSSNAQEEDQYSSNGSSGSGSGSGGSYDSSTSASSGSFSYNNNNNDESTTSDYVRG